MKKEYLALRIAFRFLGLPYKWGGDDPLAGFDCSGFVIELLKSVGILPHSGDWRAMDLYAKFKDKKTETPEIGCLAFWGETPETITHVEFCIDPFHSIGASGGGSKTKTNADAINQNAYIKIRPFNPRGAKYFVNPFAP